MKKNRKSQNPYNFDYAEIESFDFGKEDRVAFLSTQSRTYFPERPGTSRFAVANAPHLGSPEDAGPLKYSPKDPRLFRPISLKGCGIGGLSGPRFAKDHHDKTPPPWHYQPDVVPPIKTYEPKKASYLEFLRKSLAHSRLYGSSPRVTISHHAADPEPYKVPKSELIKYKPTFKECASHIIAFGSSKRNSRVGAEVISKTAGVGNYELVNPPSGKLKISGSFGIGPNRLIPSVSDRCTYKYDTCFECQDIISTADYYRTPKRIRNPFAVPISLDSDYLSSMDTTTNTIKESRQLSPTFPRTSSNRSEQREMIRNKNSNNNGQAELLHPDETIKETLNNKETTEANTTTILRRKRSQVSSCVPVQKGLIFVNLCRKCFCKGLQGENKHWNKEFLTVNFKKTRNCSYIHDHQNIEQVIHKTSCKTINKLRRRETLLAKYYGDDPCDKIRQRRL